MRLPRALVLVTVTSLGGCSSGGGETASDGQAYCEDLFAMIAQRAPACEGGDPARWQALVQTVLGTECAHIGASLASGRQRFDADAAATCTAAFRAATCGTLQPETSPCTTVYVGLVPVGGACVSSDDCVDRGVCDQKVGACGGTCLARRQIGESCSSSLAQLCVSGASCQQGTCVAHTTAVEGGACGDSADCRQGYFGSVLYCAIPAGSSDGTCQPVKTSGACGGFRECQPTLFCSTDAHACTPKLAVGAACKVGDGGCVPGAVCAAEPGAANGTCVENPRPDGATCGFMGVEFVGCTGWCDASTIGALGTCHAKKKDGEACKGDDECTGRCDETAATCVPACPL